MHCRNFENESIFVCTAGNLKMSLYLYALQETLKMSLYLYALQETENESIFVCTAGNFENESMHCRKL